MRIGIMQPYIFPYIGYFQLLYAVDTFVFYDDVNFIKRGWINRNRILMNNQAQRVSIPCVKASQNKRICDVAVDYNNKAYHKNLKTIAQAYQKAPYFHAIYPLIKQVLTTSEASIAALAKRSVMTVADYLEIDTSVRQSSLDFPDTYGYDRADRLIAICKQLDGTDYINAIGGQHLYDKQYFAQQGLQLHFLDSPAITYAQFNNEFVPNLSIIDVLMFNSKTQIKAWLADFKLR